MLTWAVKNIPVTSFPLAVTLGWVLSPGQYSVFKGGTVKEALFEEAFV
jgi:hypothetical protein